MQIILTRNQFEFIAEAEREHLGRGMHHNVFSTRFSKDYLIKQGLQSGDIVAKCGQIEIVNFYANEFAKHSDIFPKIYKVGVKYNSKQACMFIENLSNKKFHETYKKIFNVVNDGLKKNGHRTFESIWTLNNSIMSPESELYPQQLDLKLLADEYVEEYATKDLQDFYAELKSIVQKIYDLIELGELKPHFLAGADLHHGNFGMTKDGKIKCLDF